MFLLAVAGMFSFASCNNNATEETTDSVAPVEEMVEEAEQVVDSAMATVEDAAAEATVAE